MALHVGVWSLSIRHAVLCAIRFSHLAIFGRTRIAGVIHGLAVVTVSLIITNGLLLAVLIALAVAAVILTIIAVRLIILIGAGIAQITLKRANQLT